MKVEDAEKKFKGYFVMIIKKEHKIEVFKW
jgi:hypothetical protein